jgi:hypothetical protein
MLEDTGTAVLRLLQDGNQPFVLENLKIVSRQDLEPITEVFRQSDLAFRTENRHRSHLYDHTIGKDTLDFAVLQLDAEERRANE